MVEGNLDPAKLVPVLHYDGTPITARFIRGAIADRARSAAGPARLGVAAE
jgi:2-oxoglutarate/2-oxoacid ferredoxin oxidoreductase subunit alpha